MNELGQAIQLKELTKDFPLMERGRYLRAVDSLSLEIPRNSVFGLLGPNGSGKSTTIRMLLGLSEPSKGEVRILGGSPKDPGIRRQVGYLPDAPYYHKFLTGKELLRFFGKLMGLSKVSLEQQSVELLGQFGLSDAMDRKLGSYSKGMLQRLGFAQALLGDPEILVLDEPTAGVDPVGAAEVGDFVRGLRERGKTVLLCSHLLTQVQDLCDAVGIMNKGRLLASGGIEQLLRPSENPRFSLEGLEESAQAEVARLVELKGGRMKPMGQDLESLFRELVSNDDERSKGQ
ncbi:ABC transporter ATP-binding protein [Pelagicoccus sp. NFK12]|uniref:ABC transporter ATP-binding protein n=1 Tax=Pelagicoccus enzymogenes TaxID=2773457 RepID=A0A927F8T1_9BACT|nr:ABC transporter ATP-binding protein [Pelagicoccus enzymogenes]MBD5779346.1 ABC transporter ATP-binding protein [Pelagicoccus enzymogenes]MDQ8198302.1 ABC transporter ATP-binding protein [Pelagicoccus enzymogenes]